jgi:2-C-methyl-D-erythritol 4-phosphate cytidylyltransferase
MGVAESTWVLVHDAARCLITPVLIDRLLQSCLQDEVGGLLALPLPDTLKSERQGRVDQTLDRSHKWLAQTPQMFRLGVLREALMMSGPQVTDEASAIEALGLSPRLVASASYNFKVTYPDDLRLAQGVLTGRLSDDWKQG